MPQNQLLRVNSSSRYQDSLTRAVTAEVTDLLQKQLNIVVNDRDVAAGLPFVNEAWVNANFTDPDERNSSQIAALQESDTLVNELKEADYLIIGAPIYNFNIPASLKAWIDLVARARETFRYTENGPEGLVTVKKAWLVVASGGVPIGSEMDFATGYLRHVLAFLGIDEVSVIDANTWIKEPTNHAHFLNIN
ncbi:FMN-dependent NADH-azoreductase [Methylophaga frappieri]|uniref:FMN dependent NADH:quinone oxidoreductase n=1 Tax=Methylophaga frappieri (strain ATCC BAA-2434 / DSM 25690 / JAM7) TaxID=754477 RepID=I1YES6_METFJ|nr:NAD(P)H-dependent oxidoreductase [Methylophaga frappieri]AFJ01419.1 FMN-dependent NADH-azoreductase [Methylophaga frappieri]